MRDLPTAVAMPLWRRADNDTPPPPSTADDAGGKGASKPQGMPAAASGPDAGIVSGSLLPSSHADAPSSTKPEPSLGPAPTPKTTVVTTPVDAGAAAAAPAPPPPPITVTADPAASSSDPYPDDLYTTLTADNDTIYLARKTTRSLSLERTLLIVAGVVLLLALGGCAFCCWRKRRAIPGGSSKRVSRLSTHELGHRRSIESARPLSVDSKPSSVDKAPVATVPPPPMVDNSAALANGTMFSVMAASLAAAKFNNLRHQQQQQPPPPPAPASYQAPAYYPPLQAGAHAHSAPVIRHSAAPAPSTQAPAPPVQSIGPLPARTTGIAPPVIPRAPASVEPSQYDNGKDYKVDRSARDNALAHARRGVGAQHMRPLPPSSDAGMTSISRRETGPRRYSPGKPSTPSSAPLTQSTLMAARSGEQSMAGPTSRMSGSRHNASMSIRRG